MLFEQVATGGCRSYVIGCTHSCAAALIDPELSQIDRYLALAAHHGLRIRHVIDTHTHADHFSATRELARRLEVPITMHQTSTAPFVDMRVGDGESIALGQLRWAPKPGVAVNRHLVAVQTSIEFDAQRGVITVGPAAEGAKPRLEEDMLELDERPAPDVLTALELQVAQCDDDIWHNEQMVGALKAFVHSLGAGDGSYTDDLVPLDAATAVPRVHWAPAVIVRHRTE